MSANSEGLMELEDVVNIDESNQVQVKSNVENLELYSDEYPFSLSLRLSTFEDDSKYNKFIKNVEKLIRQCNEYKLWTEYIRDVVGLTTCAMSNERIDQVKIEIHHHIPSLYILVKGLVNEKLENNQEFCSFDIAMEAIKIHYANRIGYVPLIKSLHEKFHNGFLEVPIQFIHGNYTWFVNNYSKYLDQEDLDIINQRLISTGSNIGWSKDNYNNPEENKE